jgi:2-keto-4-pentenoate hydratase/2-oxohepta-3-ene-1,7-dioic acid hydratase in catechol pathway
MGDRIPIDKANEHVFGVVVMNDWSGDCRIIVGFA